MDIEGGVSVECNANLVSSILHIGNPSIDDVI